MNNHEKIKVVLEGLERVKSRPHVYIGQDFGPVGNFLAGYELACTLLLNEPFNPAAASKTLREHGFDPEGPDPIVQMRNRGMSEEEITVERLGIAVDIWKKTLAS